MKRITTLQKTVKLLAILSEEKLKEAADFIYFLHEKQQKDEFQSGIQKLIELSASFDFLDTEECIYTLDDIEEKY
jgi:hypothetical protein